LRVQQSTVCVAQPSDPAADRHTWEAGTMPHRSHSNSPRETPDCRMIDAGVPPLISDSEAVSKNCSRASRRLARASSTESLWLAMSTSGRSATKPSPSRSTTAASCLVILASRRAESSRKRRNVRRTRSVQRTVCSLPSLNSAGDGESPHLTGRNRLMCLPGFLRARDRW
jgi:hypothetical protein